MGLYVSFGAYDRTLALRFLGLEGGTYTGGRLAHYLQSDDELPAAADRALRLTEETEAFLAGRPGKDMYALLEELYS